VQRRRRSRVREEIQRTIPTTMTTARIYVGTALLFLPASRPTKTSGVEVLALKLGAVLLGEVVPSSVYLQLQEHTYL
jgi:hypothetical protein